MCSSTTPRFSRRAIARSTKERRSSSTSSRARRGSRPRTCTASRAESSSGRLKLALFRRRREARDASAEDAAGRNGRQSGTLAFEREGDSREDASDADEEAESEVEFHDRVGRLDESLN